MSPDCTHVVAGPSHVGCVGPQPHSSRQRPEVLPSAERQTRPTSQSSNPDPDAPSIVHGSPSAVGVLATGRHAVDVHCPSVAIGMHFSFGGQSWA